MINIGKIYISTVLSSDTSVYFSFLLFHYQKFTISYKNHKS